MVVSPGSMKFLVALQLMIVVVLMIWLFTDIFMGTHKVLSLGKAVSVMISFLSHVFFLISVV